MQATKLRVAGKHPILRQWTANASANADVIRGWWRDRGGLNVGLVTGRGSGVVVLDVDPRNGGDDALHELELCYSPLPQTIEVLTGGGGNALLFRAPDVEIKTTAGVLGAGLDVRAEGGLAVMPPSLHASGRRYEWSTDGHPDEVELAEMPAWLVALLSQRTANLTRKDYRGEAIEKGERLATLLRLAGKMRRGGFTARAISAALHELNSEMCRPPLDASEIERLVTSAARWPVGKPWTRSTIALIKHVVAATEVDGPTREIDRLRDRAVLMVLAAHADDKGSCWPSYQTIEHLAGVPRKVIRPTLDRLEQMGCIETLRNNAGRVNRYRVVG